AALVLAAWSWGREPPSVIVNFVFGVLTIKVVAWLVFNMRYNLIQENFKANSRFRALVEASPLGIFLADAEGHHYYVNKRWEEIFGLSDGKGLGRGWVNCLLPHERDVIVQAWEGHVKGECASAGELAIRTPAGELRWIRGVNSVMR